MVRRHLNAGENEPEQTAFEMPSEREHLFQVVDFIKSDESNIVVPKLEVVGGQEEGRTMLNRVTLDETERGFFATRLLLKAMGLPYKGDIDIDTDDWIGRQFYATVLHVESKGKTYANIKQFNFDKKVEQFTEVKQNQPEQDTVQWDE